MHKWHCPLHISCKRKLIIQLVLLRLVFLFFFSDYTWENMNMNIIFLQQTHYQKLNIYLFTNRKVLLLASIRTLKHDDARRRQILFIHCQMVRRENLLKLIIVFLCMSRGYIYVVCSSSFAQYINGPGVLKNVMFLVVALNATYDLCSFTFGWIFDFFFYHPFRSEVNDQS